MSKKRSNSWYVDRDNRLIRDYKSSMPQWALIQKYGITWETVNDILNQNNVEKRWRDYPRVQKFMDNPKQLIG